MFDPTKLTPYNQTSSSKPTSGGFNPSNLQPYSSQSTPTTSGGDGMLIGMAKGLVSAPATMIARPFQAAQAFGQYLGSNTDELAKKSAEGTDGLLKLIQLRREKLARGEDVTHISKAIADIQGTPDAATQEISAQANWKPTAGGVVAEAPQSWGDVKKDIGRGVETVALGMGAPLASGAAFGFGSSLEQGNDVMSMETLGSTLLGLGLGKVTDVVGKPLFNGTGKVIGIITPDILKKVASKGAGALSDFMKNNQLLGGVAEPVSKKITSGAAAFDSGINKGTKAVFNGIGKGLKSQYPTMGDDIAKHYEKTEMDRLVAPTKTSGTSFAKAKEVAKQAEAQGVDLQRVAKDNKIYPSDYVVDGKFATSDVADALENDAVSRSGDIFRPALAEAEPGVARTPISEVRQRIVTKINQTPDSVLSPEQKRVFIKKVAAEYADTSATAAKYKDGYSLTNLYDSKLQTSSNLYKTPKGGGAQSLKDSLTAQQKKIESEVFRELLVKNSPKEVGIDKYFKAQQQKFILANYLRSLNGINAPRSLFQRGVKRFSQLSGATIGAQTAGPFGMFSGYQFGGMLAETFANASNPVKVLFLKSIGKTEPEIYAIMKEYISEKEASRLLRAKLPAPNLFGDTITPARIQRQPKMLPAPSPRIIIPNKRGTPNRISNLYSPGGDQGAVGGIQQY